MRFTSETIRSSVLNITTATAAAPAAASLTSGVLGVDAGGNIVVDNASTIVLQ